jgi:hypothetical protein
MRPACHPERSSCHPERCARDDKWCLVALLLLAPIRLTAQTIPTLYATRDLTAEGKQAGLNPHSNIRVSANGTIAVSWAQAPHVVLIDRDMRRVQILGTPGDKPGAINAVGPHGWIGDSLWIMDTKLWRLTIFTPDLNVARTLERPLSIEGPPGTGVADHSGLPAVISAIYPGGDLLTEEFTLNNFLNKGGSRGVLLRTTPNGEYRGSMGPMTDGREDCMLPKPWTLPMRDDRDFCGAPQSALSPDGRFKVVVRLSSDSTDHAHFSVTSVGEHGDTLYHRLLPFTPVPVLAADLDSAVAQRLAHARDLASRSASANRTRYTDADIKGAGDLGRSSAGTMYPPVLFPVLADNDGTVWLELFSREPGHHWIELDATGAPIGTLALPANVRLLQGARSTVWGVEDLADSSISVVRYHVEVAKP